LPGGKRICIFFCFLPQDKYFSLTKQTIEVRFRLLLLQRQALSSRARVSPFWPCRNFEQAPLEIEWKKEDDAKEKISNGAGTFLNGQLLFA